MYREKIITDKRYKHVLRGNICIMPWMFGNQKIFLIILIIYSKFWMCPRLNLVQFPSSERSSKTLSQYAYK